MEQEKIGKFIQSLRKEKGMTQKDLADSLGITDRAISKWENGRGIPEVSLMKPLCDVFGITVNELLSGERIDQKDYLAKSEFNFLNTMDFSDKKIKKKNTLLRLVLALTAFLVLSGIILAYSLPVTRGYFRRNEEIQILYVHKTLPICPEGEMFERYGSGDFVEQDITEKIDMDRLKNLLPLLRMSIFEEPLGRHWVGDVTYEIFGCFRNGPRAGKTFQIYLGDLNYLMHHATGRGYEIVEPESWMKIFAWLEGWNNDDRETFQWDSPRTFSIFYQGTLYTGIGQHLELPQDAPYVGSVRRVTEAPAEEWDCSFGTQGDNIHLWDENGVTYLAVRVDFDEAYGIPITQP